MDNTWKKVTTGDENRITWDGVPVDGVVEGIYERLTERDDGKGTDVHLIVDGVKKTAPAGKVLVRQLVRVPPGTVVAIQHNGMQAPKGDGMEYRGFSVFYAPDVVLLPKNGAPAAGDEEVPF
jgi:hypothetical protein